jgi:hypothetical protein
VAEAFAESLLWHVQPVAPASGEVVRDAQVLLDREAAPRPAAPASGALPPVRRTLAARAGAPRLADQVRLVGVVQDGDEWTLAARRTCCLRWCLPGGTRCEDCPLLREPEPPAALRSRLSEAIARGRALREDPDLLEWAGGRRS